MSDTCKSLFYNSQNGDRVYDADSFEHLLKKFFTSGVFTGACQVTADGTGMTCSVAAGYANCDGKIRIFDSATALSFDNAHATYSRIDTVVVERNDTNREITLKVIKGTYSATPTPTAPVRTGGVYQLVLAEVYIAAGETAVSQAIITDKRPDTTVCGYVVTAVQTPDFSELYDQFTEAFMLWFDAIRDQLDEDAAGHLQNEIDDIAANNAGAHNAIYRGKYLGSSVSAEQFSAISSGTFEGLYVGDYWTIDSVNYRIAAFDYWLGVGDPACDTHHVVIVPDTALANSVKMNATDAAPGAYAGSNFYTGSAANTAKATVTAAVKSAFGSAHVLSHKEMFASRVTYEWEDQGGWDDSEVDLLSEIMVFGANSLHNVFAEETSMPFNCASSKSQLPLFFYRHDLIGIGVRWWLRDVVNNEKFATVEMHGQNWCQKSSTAAAIRPVFAIKG